MGARHHQGGEPRLTLVHAHPQQRESNVKCWCPMKSDGNHRVSEAAIPPLPNEIIGLIVDQLRGDIPALRVCSTASTLWYHFCKRPLYQNINLDTPDKVDEFIMSSKGADLPFLRHTLTLSLGIVGMASWRYADKLVAALGVFAKKSSIRSLTLKEIKFTLVSSCNVADLIETTGILSGTVSKLDLFDCLFTRHEDIESLIRSFPLCKSLRLRRCSWQSTQLAPMFSSLPVHAVSLRELEITTRKTLSIYDLSALAEQDWLDTTRLTSLTYSVIEHSMANKMLNAVKNCHLENLKVFCRHKESFVFVFRKLKRVMPRVRFLTIASDGAGAIWSLSLLLRNFRALPGLEHLTVATMDPISKDSPFWTAVDTLCGSGKVYDTLEMVEFSFASPHPASGPEYVKREELREKLPYLAEHGMLKVSDPNVGMDWLRS